MDMGQFTAVTANALMALINKQNGVEGDMVKRNA